MSPGSVFFSYIRSLSQTLSWALVLSLVLMVSLSLMEGVGLLLLIPLLGLAGVPLGEGTMATISSSIDGLYQWLGLEPTLVTILGTYVLILSANVILKHFQNLLIPSLAYRFELKLQKEFYKSLVLCRWRFITSQRATDFIHLLTRQMDRVGVATEYFLYLLATISILLIYLLLALSISGVITGILFLSGLALLFFLRRKVERAREIGEDISQSTRDFYSESIQHLQALKTTKSFGLEERQIKNFSQLAHRVVEAYLEAVQNSSITRVWFRISAVVILSAFVYFSLEVFEISTAALLLLIFLYSRIIPFFASCQQHYQTVINALPAYWEITSLMKGAQEAREVVLIQDESPLEMTEEIGFEKVHFSYPEQNLPAVEDLTFSIAAGWTTALVGPSGSGKTTVADLTMGLIFPTQGSVKIDGIPLTTSHLKHWRSQIGYVPQETFLFHDTIRNNLLWAAPEATDEDIWKSLNRAEAAEFISRLPQGLEAVVGDRGNRFSGGEKQRLALARALLRKPRLLILDEATSALDGENEAKILQALEGIHGDLTVLIITHRLTSVRRADRILVMEKGRLLEEGTWEELVDQKGRFCDFCRAQNLLEPM